MFCWIIVKRILFYCLNLYGSGFNEENSYWDIIYSLILCKVLIVKNVIIEIWMIIRM